MVGYVPQNAMICEPAAKKPYPVRYQQVLQGGYRHDAMHYTASELASLSYYALANDIDPMRHDLHS